MTRANTLTGRVRPWDRPPLAGSQEAGVPGQWPQRGAARPLVHHRLPRTAPSSHTPKPPMWSDRGAGRTADRGASRTSQQPGCGARGRPQTPLPCPVPGWALTTTPAARTAAPPEGGTRPGRHDWLRSGCKDAAWTCAHRYTRRTRAAAPAHRRGRTCRLYTCRGPSTPCRPRRCREGGTRCCYLQAQGKQTGRRVTGSRRPRVPTEVGIALREGHKVARGGWTSAATRSRRRQRVLGRAPSPAPCTAPAPTPPLGHY